MIHERVTNAWCISMGAVYNIKQKKEITPDVPSSSTFTAPYKSILMPKALDVSEKSKMDISEAVIAIPGPIPERE
ncbi:hypothetical protein Trydic_g20525 [Trypoxylus dichotomus]